MKLAVFDIDGTLTLGDGLGTRCFFSAFDDVFGEGSADRRLDSYAESTDGAIAAEAARRALGREAVVAELTRFKDLYLARLEREIAKTARAYRPVSGAESMLPVLAARGDWHVAIATGNWRRAASLKLACAGIGEPPVAACSEDGASRREVLAAAISAAASHCGSESFESVVYVGDQPWDLRAARELGVAFVGIAAEARGRHLEREGARVLGGYGDANLFVSALEEVAAATLLR